ncbi:hypothetical protein V6Z11_A05G301800 [Gossypium hirsutum]
MRYLLLRMHRRGHCLRRRNRSLRRGFSSENKPLISDLMEIMRVFASFIDYDGEMVVEMAEAEGIEPLGLLNDAETLANGDLICY